MSFLVVIPARHGSTRLPGKMLLDLAGKPMVVRVAERARQSAAMEVIVATDHVDIESALRLHGVSALMTRSDHPSGTDRLAEVVQKLGLADDDVVVNVQGDEPLIDPELVNAVASELDRHPIPFARDAFARPEQALPAQMPALHHIGIYAYRVSFLKCFAGLPQSPAEKFEALEQLRALHHGYRIAVRVWDEPIEAGVDTAEDLDRVRARFIGPI